MQVLRVLSQMGLHVFNLEDQSNVQPHPKNVALIPSSVTSMLKEEREDSIIETSN